MSQDQVTAARVSSVDGRGMAAFVPLERAVTTFDKYFKNIAVTDLEFMDSPDMLCRYAQQAQRDFTRHSIRD